MFCFVASCSSDVESGFVASISDEKWFMASASYKTVLRQFYWVIHHFQASYERVYFHDNQWLFVASPRDVVVVRPVAIMPYNVVLNGQVRPSPTFELLEGSLRGYFHVILS